MDHRWVATSVANVTKVVERYWGRFLARTASNETLEGERPASRTLVIIEWPSKRGEGLLRI